MIKAENRLFVLLKPYVLWVVLPMLYFTIGARGSWQIALVTALLYTAAQYIIFILNLKQWIPKYFEPYRSKFFNYNLLLVLLISALLTVLIHIAFKILPVEFAPDHKSNILFPMFLHVVICAISVWASIFIYLIDKEKETQAQIETLKRDKAESELKYLKTQINPHFLFNALNNIYSMAYSVDKKVSEKISMLSDMLRYVLYDCESDYIPLEMEIEYIRSFVEFQQLKTEKKQNINFVISVIDQNKSIAPMLLAPLVENGFKHSGIEKDSSGFVDINLSQEGDRLFFKVSNSISTGLNVQQPEKGKGIGIDNVKNRLKLLYPKKYNFTIDKTSDIHTVILELVG